MRTLLLLFFSFAFAQENTFSQNEEKVKHSTLEGSFLYWKIEEGETDFCCNNAILIDKPHGSRGDLNRAAFNWHPAFRLSYNYLFNCDAWQFETIYTYFSNETSKVIKRHEGRHMQATFPQFTTTDLIRADSVISLRGHQADLLLARSWQISKNIRFTLFNGMSGAWLKHNWEIVYHGEDPGETNVKPKWRFKGAGLKLGGIIDWYLGKGFNWDSRTAIALIYGNYDNRMRLFTTSSDGLRETREEAHLDDFRIATNLQFQMGPSWEKHFCTWAFKFFVGYEINVWFNVHQINREDFQDPSDPNNLNPQSRHASGVVQMHGLTVAATVNF